MSSKYSFASVVERQTDSMMNAQFVPRSANRNATIWGECSSPSSNLSNRKGRLYLRSSSESLKRGEALAQNASMKRQHSTPGPDLDQGKSIQSSSVNDAQKSGHMAHYPSREARTISEETTQSVQRPSPTMDWPTDIAPDQQRTLRSKGMWASTDTALNIPVINPLSPTKLTLSANPPTTLRFPQPLTPPLTPLYLTSPDRISTYALADSSPSKEQRSPSPTPHSTPKQNAPNRRFSLLAPSPIPQLSYPPSSPPSSRASSLDLRRPLSPLPPAISFNTTTLPDLDNLSLYSTDSAAPPPISLGIHRRSDGDHVCVPLTTLNRRVDSGYSEGEEVPAPIPHLGPRLPTGYHKAKRQSQISMGGEQEQYQSTANKPRFGSLRSKLPPSPSLSSSTAKSLLRSFTQRRKNPRQQQQQQSPRRTQLPQNWLPTQNSTAAPPTGPFPVAVVSTSPIPSFSDTPPSMISEPSTANNDLDDTAPATQPDAIRVRGREYPLSSLRPVSSGRDSAIGGYSRGKAQVVLIAGTEFEIWSGETREKVERVLGAGGR